MPPALTLTFSSDLASAISLETSVEMSRLASVTRRPIVGSVSLTGVVAMWSPSQSTTRSDTVTLHKADGASRPPIGWDLVCREVWSARRPAGRGVSRQRPAKGRVPHADQPPRPHRRSPTTTSGPPVRPTWRATSRWPAWWRGRCASSSASRPPARSCCSSPPRRRWSGPTPVGVVVRLLLAHHDRPRPRGLPARGDARSTGSTTRLMAIFFFVVGLEIKRELVTGELRDRRPRRCRSLAARRRDGRARR